MNTLIFDIETVGEKWSDLDSISQKSLTSWVERMIQDKEDLAVRLEDIKNRLSFSPLTAQVVAIGFYDVTRRQGAVYYQSDSNTDEEVGEYVLKPRTENEMLADFWEGAKSYDRFVSFNGRRFDVPFLNIRSAVHSIRPSRDLMEGRYLYQQKTVQHIDLQDQLTYYGAMYRKPSLHMFCRAFGIKTSKVEISGEDVAKLFSGKKFRDIALYSTRDVTATTELYNKWDTYLAPQNDIITIE